MPRRRVLPVTALVALGGLAVVGSGGPASSGGEVAVVEFDYTGATQTWTVPEGVTEITATACGAQGGTGVSNMLDTPQSTSGPGFGACATADLAVTPGETLVIEVGGVGTASITTAPPSAASSGGYNGGAAGGTATPSATGGDPMDCFDVSASAVSAGGGGGGASDIRQGGTSPAERVLVGGGGGGSGATGLYLEQEDIANCAGVDDASGALLTATAGSGGDGGENGEDGGAGLSDTDPPAGGGGGQQGAAGLAGALPNPGGDGTGADGGPGATTAFETSGEICGDEGYAHVGVSTAGGGGGGWFGGGGGAAGYTDIPGLGGGAGGGGGSSHGPSGTSFEAGVNEGPGSVLITYVGPDDDDGGVDDDDVDRDPGIVHGAPTFAC